MLLVVFKTDDGDKTLFLLTTDLTWRKFAGVYINTFGGITPLEGELISRVYYEDELIPRVYYEDIGKVRESFMSVEGLNQSIGEKSESNSFQINEVIVCGFCS